MDGKIIAVVCVVLIAGLGAGTLIGISLGDKDSKTSDSGSGDSGPSEESKALADYKLQFDKVEDGTTWFYITFDAGKGGFLDIYDGKTLMKSYMVDPGNSSRHVSVNTALSSLNHLTFEFEPRDILNEFVYSVTYNTTYGVIMSGDETIYGYAQTPVITTETNHLSGYTAYVRGYYPTVTIVLGQEPYYFPVKNAFSLPEDNKIADIMYLEIDFVKFYPKSETWLPPS